MRRAQAASKIVGYGAVKYSDLKNSRTTDYCFSYDKMLDPKGVHSAFSAQTNVVRSVLALFIRSTKSLEIYAFRVYISAYIIFVLNARRRACIFCHDTDMFQLNCLFSCNVRGFAKRGEFEPRFLKLINNGRIGSLGKSNHDLKHMIV